MKKVLAIFAALWLLAGCASAGSATNMNVLDFSKKIAEPGVVLVDVRTPAEFMSGHIEGAINIDFNSGNFESEISKLSKADIYAIYCRSGSRSSQAASVMDNVGFQEVYNLNAGIIDWTNNSMPLVTN